STREYVFPEDVSNPRKMEALFRQVPQYCFLGHTHIPGVFTKGREYIPPDDCNHKFQLSEEPAIVNVGSVGQPRDTDTRAWYVIRRDQGVEFRRVESPRDKTWQP